MRNTCDSSNTACTVSLSFLDDSRSVPNGFSMITRECSLARPDEPSMVTTEPNAAGGTARWNSRPAAPDPLRPLRCPLRPGRAGDLLLRVMDGTHQR